MVGFTSPSLHTCRLVVPYLGSRPQNSAHRNRPALRGGAWRKTRKRLGAGSTSPHPKAGKGTERIAKLPALPSLHESWNCMDTVGRFPDAHRSLERRLETMMSSGLRG